MYENFGDIGMNIKRMVDDFQQIAKSNQNIQTVGCMLFSVLDGKFSFHGVTIQKHYPNFCKTSHLSKYSLKISPFAEDMAKFVDNYPQYRKMHGNVSKHVTLVTEMSKIVEERKLMLVSQAEQELACNGGKGAAFEVIWPSVHYINVCNFWVEM